MDISVESEKTRGECRGSELTACEGTPFPNVKSKPLVGLFWKNPPI